MNLAKDDCKKHLKRLQAENRKKKLEQGKPWRRRGGYRSSKDSTRRGINQRMPAPKKQPVEGRGIDRPKRCDQCGQVVPARKQHSSISGSTLCERCAKHQAGRGT